MCIKEDESKSKILELIISISNTSLNENDCILMRNVIKEISLLFQMFHWGEDNEGDNNQHQSKIQFQKND